MRPASFMAFLALAIGLLAGCRSPAPGDTEPAVLLRVGTLEDSPPFVFFRDNRRTGVEADFARALAARLDMKPRFRSYAAKELAPALLNGEVDILMAGLAITEAGRLQMDFSTPYLVVGQAAMIRAADMDRYNTEIKIRGTQDRVGVVRDSTGEELVKNYFTGAVRHVFARPEAATVALRKGEIDLFIFDAPAAWWLVRQSAPGLALAPPVFARQEIAWGFRRGSVALREAANRALDDWRQDGTLEEILKRWMPVSQ